MTKLLSLGSLIVAVATLSLSCADRKATLDVLLKGYDQLMAPSEALDSGNSTLVNVSCHILHIYGLSAKDEELNVGIYLRAMWRDERLAYNDTLSKADYISVYNWRYKTNIWQPDIFLVDAKSADIPKNPMPAQFMWIYKDGRVFVSNQLIGQMFCSMDWSRFPMDVQKCPIKLSLYSYYQKTVKLSWVFEHTVDDLLRTQPINDFYFMNSKQLKGAHSYGEDLIIDLYFTRNFSYYLRQVYVPSLFLVLLAYIPCWMKEGCEKSRLVLVLSVLACMLVLNITVTISQTVPSGVSVTALEVWLASCTAFIMMALLQTIIMRSLGNDITLKTGKQDTIPLAEAGPDASTDRLHYTVLIPAPRLLGITMTMDVIWRIFYPSLIVLYNIIYWCIYAA